MPKKPRRPVKSKEQFTLDSIGLHLPGGEWVQEEEAEVVEVPGCDPGGSGFESHTPLSVTVIGGTSYDKDALLAYLQRLDPETIIVGAGRGVESDLAKSDLSVQVVGLEPERFGKLARKVNVEQTLCVDMESPLVIVGSGERPKQARAWLQRAKWPREVIEL